MFDPNDRLALPKVGVEHSRRGLKGIHEAVGDLKLRYLSAVAAAVEGQGEWQDVASARTDLEEVSERKRRWRVCGPTNDMWREVAFVR